jgi:hypothetical protein
MNSKGGGGCNYYYYSLPFSSCARFSEKGAVAEDKGIPCSGHVIAHCFKNFRMYRLYSELSLKNGINPCQSS